MGRPTTDEQRDALKVMWPQIRAYCEQRGLTRARLVTGNYGIPVDGGKLILARSEVCLTRQELAAAMGVSPALIAKAEDGIRSPSPAVLAALARELGCAPASLLPD